MRDCASANIPATGSDVRSSSELTEDGAAPQAANSRPAFLCWPVWSPLIGILLASMLIRGFDLDRKISEMNYNAEQNEWPFERADPWLSFYRYGTYPPLFLGIAGAVIALFGHKFWPKAEPSRITALRKGGLFLALVLLIGPGLLVNSGLKSLWGRPRPVQCKEFGGEFEFRQVGEWAIQRFPNSSFPSGHASIAFFLMAPAFLVNPNQPRLRRAWFLGGIGYGLAMGFTRVLQGGHFLSDVLWAGVIVYFVSVALATLLIRYE